MAEKDKEEKDDVPVSPFRAFRSLLKIYSILGLMPIDIPVKECKALTINKYVFDLR